MSFLELTDVEFISFKREALKHLAIKLSVDIYQEYLVERVKGVNEPICIKLEKYFDAHKSYNNRNKHKPTEYAKIISDVKIAHSLYMQAMESL